MTTFNGRIKLHANRCKLRRLEAGIRTQHEARARAGISHTTITQLERYKIPLTLKIAQRLARVYGCSPLDLFDPDELNGHSDDPADAPDAI